MSLNGRRCSLSSLAGSEENGSTRWLLPALLEHGVDVANMKVNDPAKRPDIQSFVGSEGTNVADLFPPVEQLLKDGQVYEKVSPAMSELTS